MAYAAGPETGQPAAPDVEQAAMLKPAEAESERGAGKVGLLGRFSLSDCHTSSI